MTNAKLDKFPWQSREEQPIHAFLRIWRDPKVELEIHTLRGWVFSRQRDSSGKGMEISEPLFSLWELQLCKFCWNCPKVRMKEEAVYAGIF